MTEDEFFHDLMNPIAGLELILENAVTEDPRLSKETALKLRDALIGINRLKALVLARARENSNGE